jgi:hypothetical protein
MMSQNRTSFNNLDQVLGPASDPTSAPVADWEGDADLATIISDDYLHGDKTCSSISISQSEPTQSAVMHISNVFSPRTDLSLVTPAHATLLDTLCIEEVYGATDILGVERTLKKVLKHSTDFDDQKRSISLAVRIMLKRSRLDEFFSFMVCSSTLAW